MKLENQVVSLELSKQLKELGFEQDSLYYHLYGDVKSEIRSIENLSNTDEHWVHLVDKCSAYTVAELGKMLPVDTSNGDYEIKLEKDGINNGY